MSSRNTDDQNGSGVDPITGQERRRWHPLPADRVAMLRDAFAKALKDPELLAEAKKAKIDMQLISHEQVQKDFNAMHNQTPETLKEMGKYIKAER